MEVTSYPSEKRMNTNINNLLYMNDENKIIIYQVFTRLFGNNNNHCVYNGDITTNGCGKMADFTLKALGEIKKLGTTQASSNMPLKRIIAVITSVRIILPL